MPTNKPKSTLIKVWNNWEDGIGFTYDDGRSNGLLRSNGIIGLANELRPAPIQNTTSCEPSTASSAQYFFEDFPANLAANDAVMYVTYAGTGNVDSAAINTAYMKVDLRNATYGTEIEAPEVSNVDTPYGQAARYRDDWYIPRGTTTRWIASIAAAGAVDGGGANNLLTLGDGNAGFDHLASLNFRLSGVRKNSGAGILKTDGTVGTEADWGSYFQVGEKNLRPLAVAALQDLMFVLTAEGLFSFNDKGRSRLVFNDFRFFRTNLREVQMVPWLDGLLIPTLAGLLFYAPGERPVTIGPFDQPRAMPSPPTVLTQLQTGRWHGITIIGDNIYGLYQRDLTSDANVDILFGRAIAGDPTKIRWQCLGTTTLFAANVFTGIFISTLGFPVSSGTPTPALWYNRGSAVVASNLLEYIVLDATGTPYHSQGSIHSPRADANCHMPEIVFPQPVDLDHIVVYTQRMTTGDTWGLTVLIDGDNTGREVGPTILADGRHERILNRRAAKRLVLGVTNTTDSSSRNFTPGITRIELYGRPT